MAKADDLLDELERALLHYQQTGEPLITLGRRKPNWIIQVVPEGVQVETIRSRGNPLLVHREWLRESIVELLARGTLVAGMLPRPARFRSAFILTALSLLPGASHGGSPPSVTLPAC